MPQRILDLKRVRPITALSVYDYFTAHLASTAGIDVLLVGDSLGMAVLGYESVKFVTIEDMIRHTAAVMRGNEGSVVVMDLPDGSYTTKEQALKNCRYMKDEIGLVSVKIEGSPEIAEFLIERGFSVMGHTGLKPQSAERYSVVGKNDAEWKAVVAEAKALQDAGVFALILECVPEDLGKHIAGELDVPVIGIGAGRYTDGQILVLHDMLGLTDIKKPRFVRRYGKLDEHIFSAISNFRDDVLAHQYPGNEEIY